MSCDRKKMKAYAKCHCKKCFKKKYYKKVTKYVPYYKTKCVDYFKRDKHHDSSSSSMFDYDHHHHPHHFDGYDSSSKY